MVRLGSRVRLGCFAQTHQHPALLGRTWLEVLHRGDEHRNGKPREEAARALDRYELARASEQTCEPSPGVSRRGSRSCCSRLSTAPWSP